MQAGEPIVSEKYDTLWEIPARSVLRWDGDLLTTQYHFRSVVDYYHFLLLQFVTNQPSVALCHCCGRYFIPKTKKKTLYCDRDPEGWQDLQGVGAGAQAPAESRPDQSGRGV